jgi:hypothetical protein
MSQVVPLRRGKVWKRSRDQGVHSNFKIELTLAYLSSWQHLMLTDDDYDPSEY